MNQLEGHQTGKWLLVPFLLIVRNTGGPKTRVTGQGREAGSGGTPAPSSPPRCPQLSWLLGPFDVSLACRNQFL